MPTLWTVRDGPRSEAARGAGEPVTFQEIGQAFANYRAEFVSSSPVSFNKESPSSYPSRVLIEVKISDGLTKDFTKPGFYILEGLSPSRAGELLAKLRDAR